METRVPKARRSRAVKLAPPTPEDVVKNIARIGKVAKTLESITPKKVIVPKKAQEPEEVPKVDVSVGDVSAEELLLEVKRALLIQVKKPDPKAAFIDLAIKVCDREIPAWASKQKREANLKDYKELLEQFLVPSEVDFEEIVIDVLPIELDKE